MTENHEVAILDIRTKKAEIVAPGRYPSWSPDGKKFVYHAADTRLADTRLIHMM